MSQLQVIKDVGPKLIPFFKTVAIYFVVFIPQASPGYIAAVLKCLPIICLMIFVVWHGQQMEERFKSFWKKILCGLFFSCIGDYCLIWPDYFVLGMVAFAVGHVNYIMAFGFQPFNLPAGLCSYLVATIGCLYLLPGCTGIMLPGVPLYTLLLSTMMWRAIARFPLKKNLWSWTRLFTAAGAVLFVISDLLIGLGMFKKLAIPHAQAAIMGTYYLAQLGIALSVVDLNDNIKQE